MFSIIIALVLFRILQPQEDPYYNQRLQMVQHQIENRGIKDSSTLKAMRNVKRHLFVPKGSIKYAYDDRPLPIGYGQTISQPYCVAYMTEILKPGTDHKVLEIGTGSGYQAAVLAEIVDSMFTIEIIEELGKSAKKRLKNLEYNNVQVKIEDGYYGWEAHAPFDAIVVTAASEYIPPPLLKQLKDGGRMVIPIGSPFMVQTLMLVEKKGDKITTTSLIPVRFVSFTRSK
ncbi:MAG: protein-L-isoaspartate(D-aspartate) O-methyltransferase [Bacteroidetes bacterium]|nr:protein-L-isoaspartate(D-aspartate) O-methyltransferase [Bacteroidota bacterium]MBU1679507.1 protein-L-isoaspartate(D-aspartate) O-methyltransferase [Bacteroidota bacterium]